MKDPPKRLLGLTRLQIILLFGLAVSLPIVVLVWIVPTAKTRDELIDLQDELASQLDEKHALVKERAKLKLDLAKRLQGVVEPREVARRLFYNQAVFETLREQNLPVAMWRVSRISNGTVAKYKVPNSEFILEANVLLMEPSMYQWKLGTYEFPINGEGKGQLEVTWKNVGSEFHIEFKHSDDSTAWYLKKSVTLDKPRTIFQDKSGFGSGEYFSLPGDLRQSMWSGSTFFYRDGIKGGYSDIRITLRLKNRSQNWVYLPMIDLDGKDVNKQYYFDQVNEGFVPVTPRGLSDNLLLSF